jgi:serine O-acetyltransferase
LNARTATTAERRRLWRDIHASQPAFCRAVAADVAAALQGRGEQHNLGSRLQLAQQALRLAWVSDAFAAQALYRAKARLQALGVPILPRLAHRLAMGMAGLSIGDPVVVSPGVYIMHGQVVVDGLVRIGSGVVLAPFVTIGLRAGNFAGPVIEDRVEIGTGAKVIGPVRVGVGARVGAGAVVIDDVPPGATVVGAPARPL